MSFSIKKVSISKGDFSSLMTKNRDPLWQKIVLHKRNMEITRLGYDHEKLLAIPTLVCIYIFTTYVYLWMNTARDSAFNPSCTWAWSSVWSPALSQASSSGPKPDIQKIKSSSSYLVDALTISDLLCVHFTRFSFFSFSLLSWSSCSFAQASLKGISFSLKSFLV